MHVDDHDVRRRVGRVDRAQEPRRVARRPRSPASSASPPTGRSGRPWGPGRRRSAPIVGDRRAADVGERGARTPRGRPARSRRPRDRGRRRSRRTSRQRLAAVVERVVVGHRRDVDAGGGQRVERGRRGLEREPLRRVRGPPAPIDVSRLTTARSAAASARRAGASAVAGSSSRSRSTPSKWMSPATAMVIGRPSGAGSGVAAGGGAVDVAGGGPGGARSSRPASASRPERARRSSPRAPRRPGHRRSGPLTCLAWSPVRGQARPVPPFAPRSGARRSNLVSGGREMTRAHPAPTGRPARRGHVGRPSRTCCCRPATRPTRSTSPPSSAAALVGLVGTLRAAPGHRLVPGLITAGLTGSAVGDLHLAGDRLVGRGARRLDRRRPVLRRLLRPGRGAAGHRSCAGAARGRWVDVDAAIDALTVVVVSVIVLWGLSTRDIMEDRSVSAFVRLVMAAYPILDAVLLALVLRVLSVAPAPGRPRAAVRDRGGVLARVRPRLPVPRAEPNRPSAWSTSATWPAAC